MLEAKLCLKPSWPELCWHLWRSDSVSLLPLPGGTLAISAVFAIGTLLLFKAMLQISHASYSQPIYRTVTGLASPPSMSMGCSVWVAALSYWHVSWLALHRLVYKAGGRQFFCSLFPSFAPAQEEPQSFSFIFNVYLALDIWSLSLPIFFSFLSL